MLVGRQPYHSKFELLRTDETLKEFREHVIKKVEVLRLNEFKQRFKHPDLAFPNITSPLPNERLDEVEVFFFRQRYSRDSGPGGNALYAPELKPGCQCRKILNPDEETIICEKCQAFIHP